EGSVEAARRGGAEVIALGENVGFGRACNRALAAVSEPVTVLVNPDVELVDDSLIALAREAAATGRLLAPLVLRPDGGVQDSVHPVPASAADLARGAGPGAPRPRAPPRGRGGEVGGVCVRAGGGRRRPGGRRGRHLETG